MNFIENIKIRVSGAKKKIVLPESDDLRILTAASIVEKEGFANIILIGEEEKILQNAKEEGINLGNCEIINPQEFFDTPKFINTYYEMRKSKGLTIEEARESIINDYQYFASMLVELGYADGMVSGAIHSTADTLRAALRVVGTSKDVKTASAFFLMDVPTKEYGEDGIFIYSDCGMNQNPTSEQLVDIAYSSAKSFELLVEKEPVIAFLSHSTYGSSKCDDANKVVKAVELAKNSYPDLMLDGELQFDAAIVPSIGEKKAPGSKVAGHANVLIFPDLDAGNIGYKITERLAHAKAYGPITQGLGKPVNDLSRGCSAEDIVGVVAITALQAMK